MTLWEEVADLFKLIAFDMVVVGLPNESVVHELGIKIVLSIVCCPQENQVRERGRWSTLNSHKGDQSFERSEAPKYCGVSSLIPDPIHIE